MRKIIAENIYKTYGGNVTALKGISLTIASGTLISLLGPSGCGKTTLLRIIAGLEQMDSGKLMCDGEDFAAIPVQKRNIGMVFQHYALFPNMTVLKNVMFGLEMKKLGKQEAERRALTWLDRVKLKEKRDNYPHELSGGQQQRVALARALVTNPQILLLDEPLSALDAAVRAELRTEIRQLQLDLNITVLYVTHDQTEALAMSDKVAILRNGELVEVKEPHNIYNSPQNLFTAEFVGVASRLDGEVVKENPTRVMLMEKFLLDLPSLSRDVSKGQKLAVLIRADDVIFTDEPALDNTIRGHVAMHNFLGGSIQYKVVIGDNENLLINVPAGQYIDFPKNSPVWVRIPPNACHVYNLENGDRI